jgi:hypothetical protein
LLRRLSAQASRTSLQATFFHGLISPPSRISSPARDRHHADSLEKVWRSTLAHLPAGTLELACHPRLSE